MTISFETNHKNIIHDTQFDYYGKYLATCSSDQHIHIYEIDNQTHQQILREKIHAHQAPIWRLSWSLPEFGNLLVSCANDGSICIWKWNPIQQQLVKLFEDCISNASVNSIAFCPFDCSFVAGSSD